MTQTTPLLPAVFLDRDGTLLDELGYRGSIEGLTLLPGAAASVRRLNEVGFRTILITNQSGIARGYFDEADLSRVHVAFEKALGEEGALLDGIFYCPHLPPDADEPVPPRPHRVGCSCRKPSPGLYLEAARSLRLDLASSWAVGDSLRDLEAGRRAGVERRLLVLTGKGVAQLEEADSKGLDDFESVPDISAAVDRILSEVQGK